MKTISIDIETFSSVDLAKSGVYRYAESPDFEVLLFGYSVDGGAVSVVDLASGEKIPSHILSALEDETVIKCAFNANFERICLSRLLGYETGRYLSPVSWHCTMVPSNWTRNSAMSLSADTSSRSAQMKRSAFCVTVMFSPSRKLPVRRMHRKAVSDEHKPQRK